MSGGSIYLERISITPDDKELEELLGRAINDFGAAYHAPLVVLGDRLGLYGALATKGPLTSHELAEATGTAERYVREWLRAQAAGGYVTYASTTARYHLTDAQKAVLADPSSPVFFVGAFESAAGAVKSSGKLEDAFRSGRGVGWHEQHEDVWTGTERVFRTPYQQHLVQDWIPALKGVEDRLREGARVADVGCGHGASTILMARAFPGATFIGIDYHEGSVRTARERAEAAGVADRVRFEVASAQDFDATDLDFVTTFDCLHDMGDPVGAARHVHEALVDGGTWMIVEPFANERVEENLTPLGRAFYSASTLLCTPHSLSQDVGAALGAQAPDSQIRDVTKRGGFTHFRRATETPFNRVFEAKA